MYRLVGARLLQALLDARASEHSMRMMAMKMPDNASDLVDDQGSSRGDYSGAHTSGGVEMEQ